jgi:hypothetical protein
MNRVKFEEVVLKFRPYVDIETSLLVNIKSGIIRARQEMKVNTGTLAAQMYDAMHLAEIRTIEHELAMRN